VKPEQSISLRCNERTAAEGGLWHFPHTAHLTHVRSWHAPAVQLGCVYIRCRRYCGLAALLELPITAKNAVLSCTHDAGAKVDIGIATDSARPISIQHLFHFATGKFELLIRQIVTVRIDLR